MEKIDRALEKFKELKSHIHLFINNDISESDTRSKVIDKLLIEVLGWKENDITREGHVESGYYDYKISVPGIHIIIEAKKTFAEFILPNKHTKASYKTLISQNKEVISQIRNYAVDSGVPNGIITNGQQYIIGKLINTNGTDWKNNQCLVFNGLDEIENRFIDFYNNLSRDNIIENSGFQFLQTPKIDISKTLTSDFIDKDLEIVRNTKSYILVPILQQIFSELVKHEYDDKELVKECFVENQEIKKNRDEIERLFEDSAPVLSNVIPASNVKSISTQIIDEISRTEISKNTPAPKPIVIIGSKGAGKTTFINFLFHNIFSSETSNKYPYVYIDFRQYYDKSQLFDTEKICDDIINSIENTYKKMELYSLIALKRMYYEEIHKNNSGIWKNYLNTAIYDQKLSDFLIERRKMHSKHLEHLSRYLLRERHKRLIIIIDNADQFDVETQQKVFLFANSLNISAACGVFISLREGYYYKWRNLPPFNAYENNVYHITAPKYVDVIQKRLDYSINKLTNEYEQKSNDKDFINCITFLSTVRESILHESNQEIINFLSSTTYPNIREGLRVFGLFIISGHSDVPEYINRELFNDPNYQNSSTIPIHEFIKSIGLNNKIYYNSSSSIIHNLFFPTENTKDHFVKCRILQFLSSKRVNSTTNDISTYKNKLINIFIDFGYSYSSIHKSIDELLKYELIDTEDYISDVDWTREIDDENRIKITRKGYYYLHTLKNKFHYIDLILQDTPIFDDTYYDTLSTAFPKANALGKRFMYDRIQTIKIFLDYLESQEKKESKDILNSFGSIVNEIKTSGLYSYLIDLEKSIKDEKIDKDNR